jgi:hypothetical protein
MSCKSCLVGPLVIRGSARILGRRAAVALLCAATWRVLLDDTVRDVTTGFAAFLAIPDQASVQLAHLGGGNPAVAERGQMASEVVSTFTWRSGHVVRS